MTTHRYIHRSQLPVSCQEAFAWHEREGAFQRLVPPWENVRLRYRSGSIADGDEVHLVTRLGPLSATWIAQHFDYQPGSQFSDRQLKGPFACWVHRHGFTPSGEQACVLEDRVDYALPLGWLSQLAGGRLVRRRIERMFAYRHRVTQADLASHHRFHDRPSMKILISGSSGLVGSQLAAFLSTGGHRVLRLVRREPQSDEIRWDPAAGELDAASLEDLDAVIHLAGENIAQRRWTSAQRQRIRDSRVASTHLLSQTLARLQRPPQTLINASAIGYYGNRGDQVLDEDAPAGNGFLADVCRQWEAATDPAQNAGVRVVKLRIGVVLTPSGGALKQMLLPFRTGCGGRVGSGKQFWSWISIDDLLGIVHHALMTEGLCGPVNAVAPHPVTNAEFTKTLGHVLHRPTLLPLPRFAARIALGQMADDLLLSSSRVVPQKLSDANYDFRHPTLERALSHLLGRT